MKLDGLLALGQELPALQDLTAALRAGQPPDAAIEIYHAARPYVVATLALSLNQPLVIITPRTVRARQWVDELRTWLPDNVPVHNFADPDALSYERIPWAPETRQRRLEALVGLLTWEGGAGERGSKGDAPRTTQPAQQAAPIVVASARALVQMTLPVRELRAALRPVRQGQPFDLDRMLTSWVGLGYEAAAVVDLPGQFSRRGGIVDIWPPNQRKPLRIELFGDEIDSLRLFDPSTQRTLTRVNQTWIGPASEALPKLGERLADRLRGLDFSQCHPPARNEYAQEIEQLTAGTGHRHLEWYIPYLYSQPGCLADYLPVQGAWLIIEDAADLLATFADLAGQAEQLAKDLRGAGDVPATLAAPYFATEALRERLLAHPALHLGYSTLNGLARSETGQSKQESSQSKEESSQSEKLQLADVLGSQFAAGPRLGGQIQAIQTEVEHALRSGDRVILVSRQAPRLADLLGRNGHAVAPSENVSVPPPPGLILVQGVMEEGWKLHADCGFSTFDFELNRRSEASPEDRQSAIGNQKSAMLWFLTDAELFGWGKPKPRRPLRPRALAPEVFFADVQPGDLVVHIEHGIGRFIGLAKMPIDGIEREYLQIEYAQSDQLYVPVHQADRLARYVGAGETAPALHRLGTTEWEQVKARARRAVAEIADDLLELYAAARWCRATHSARTRHGSTIWNRASLTSKPKINSWPSKR